MNTPTQLDLATLENVVTQKSRKERTEVAILGSIACVGIVTIAVLAPNAVGILSKLVPDTRPLSQKQSVRRAIDRLITQEYITKQSGRYTLTKQGEDRLQKLLFVAQRTSAGNQRWDKKWRIVIFDIHESRKAIRDELRRMLADTGFVKLQQSVWVYPHRCDEIIALLKFHLTLGWDLIYIIADAIEGDEKLRKHFRLPPAS